MQIRELQEAKQLAPASDQIKERERVDYNNSQVFFTPLTSVINNNEQRENKMIDSGGDRGDH